MSAFLDVTRSKSIRDFITGMVVFLLMVCCVWGLSSQSMIKSVLVISSDVEAQRANAEAKRANVEAAKVRLLSERLRELGVDPDSLG
jgi:hypothetical protein